MNHRVLLPLFGLALLTTLAVGCQTAAPPLLATGFDTDPLAAGWTVTAAGEERPGNGRWLPPGGGAPGSIACGVGGWEAPALPITPFQCYRVRYAALAPQPAYVFVRFYRADGSEVAADDHTELPASATWQPREFCFVGRADATTVRLGFQARTAELRLASVRVEPVSPRVALAWAEQMAADLPPVAPTLAPDRWRLLPRTRARLAAGQPLRIVLLGDSIANDLGNSLFHLRVARAWGSGPIELIHSVRSGTGCTYYRQAGRVQEYVLRYQPDLLIVAGISTNNDAAAIRDVVQQARAGGVPEVAVFTGAISMRGMAWRYKTIADLPEDVRRQAETQDATFRARLAADCAADGVAFFDLRAEWERFLASTTQPRSSFTRDITHANDRGKQVIGLLATAFLAPAR